VLFGGTDPGRFCPTYMIFCDSFVPSNCLPPMDPNFDRRDVYLITQNALADGTYLNYIRAHYNRSTQIDPPFFSELFRGPREVELNFFTNWIARARCVRASSNLPMRSSAMPDGATPDSRETSDVTKSRNREITKCRVI